VDNCSTRPEPDLLPSLSGRAHVQERCGGGPGRAARGEGLKEGIALAQATEGPAEQHQTGASAARGQGRTGLTGGLPQHSTIFFNFLNIFQTHLSLN
jgi:hypothetical protein